MKWLPLMKLVFQKNQMKNNNNDRVDSWTGSIAKEWRAGLAALHFLTIIPPLNHKPFDEKELGRSVAYYPAVGCLIGLTLYFADRILTKFLPLDVVSALVITFWVVISGGLHIDGFFDSCDGIFGGIDPDERLRIMKDERVGAFALISGILLIIIKIAALNSLFSLRNQALLLAPIISRWGMAVAIVCFPYGRSTGLGKGIKSFAGRKQILIASVLAFVSILLIGSFEGLIITGISLVFILGISYYIIHKIPGLTGDTYGALNELVEVLVLLAFTAISRL